ncbi:MAG: hypothetical protein K0S32_1139 [Bacteroidetes bacterium]|jgi:hypothetical protein|nr:hypothetical protein [Bacteroidota bacterium]
MKKLFIFLALSFSLSSFSQIPTIGMIGGWPFTGNANDMSGSGNHGTVSGAVLTNDRFGAANSAYSFNGTSNYIVMSTGGPTGNVSRSVSFWAKTTNTVIQVGFGYGDAPGIFQILFNYSCQGVGVDNSNAALIRGNTGLTDNNWHHIVAVMDASIGTQLQHVSFYVDNVLQPTVTCVISSSTSLINSNSNYPITIGKSSNSALRFFKGSLDDFYYYNKALTPAEVSQLYNYSPCSSAPSAPTAIAGPVIACLGSTSVFSVAPVAGASSYSWTLPGGWTGTSSTNTISVTSSVSGGMISVAAVNGCGQSGYTSELVNVNPSPSVTISGSKPICKGNILNLVASGANTYTWNMGVISSGISISPMVTTSYSVTGTNSFGCQNTATTSITVSNNMAPTISVAGPSMACANTNVNLAANGASTYTWQPGNLNGFFVSTSLSVTTTFTVSGTDNNGCENSAIYTQSVDVCSGINTKHAVASEIVLFPNPTSSELNIAGLKEISKIELVNHIGQVMFTKEIKNESDIISMHSLPKGIYFVILSGEKAFVMKKIIKN